ncbi:MAG: phosphatidylglycerophosphatase A [Filimonas sp.]|nr:phosphatidylglycerophosphatase A [Filimonas sp.]
MINGLAKVISTSLGIGYIQKGSGTVAALFLCLVWFFARVYITAHPYLTCVAIVVIFALGVWSANVVEQYWGEDSSKVVIDEVGGMAVSLFLIPIRWDYVLLAFILFRFFDITKPLLIRKAEALPSGWGVMADDLLAGMYSNLLLQLVVWSNLW